MRKRRRLVGVSGILISLIALYPLMNARTFQLFGELVPRIATTDKVIALTFDDGPQPIFTEQILTILADTRIKATFFVTGAELEQHMDEAQRLVAAGHALGNHSYSHQRMIFVTPSFVRDEIESTDTLIRAAGYTGEIFFRPPFGKKLVVLPAYLARHDRTTVMWDIEPESDAAVAQNSERIIEQVVGEAQPGSIILLHVMNAGREPSRRAVRDMVLRLQAAGYRFVTIPELLAAQSEE